MASQFAVDYQTRPTRNNKKLLECLKYNEDSLKSAIRSALRSQTSCSWDDIEDVMGDLRLKLMEGELHFDSHKGKPVDFLKRIARNLVKEQARRARRATLEADLRLDGDGNRADLSDEPASPLFHARQISVSRAVCQKTTVESLLAKCPERDRGLLISIGVHGWTCEEVARGLRITPVACRQRYTRARVRAQGIFTQMHGADLLDL
jgi:RNA polymerase sigma factor (sigma-70 family)